MFQIRKHKRDLERLKKKRASQEAKRLHQWQDEIKATEERNAESKHKVLQQRKAELEAKKQARLDRAAEKEKELEAIRRDKSAIQYRREQAQRAKRREDDYAKRVAMPELENRKKVLAGKWEWRVWVEGELCVCRFATTI